MIICKCKCFNIKTYVPSIFYLKRDQIIPIWDKPQVQPHFQQPSIEEPEDLRPPQLPQRLIVVPDPYITNSQHANRPLPPTPRSSSAAAVPTPVQPPVVAQSQAAPQQPQRNSQSNLFKPVVSFWLLFVETGPTIALYGIHTKTAQLRVILCCFAKKTKVKL